MTYLLCVYIASEQRSDARNGRHIEHGNQQSLHRYLLSSSGLYPFIADNIYQLTTTGYADSMDGGKTFVWNKESPQIALAPPSNTDAWDYYCARLTTVFKGVNANEVCRSDASSSALQ